HLHQRATWLYVTLLAAIGGLSGVLFYVLMLLQPDVADKVDSYYVGYRVGKGPFDMLDHITANLRLYEAPPWILFVGPGLLWLLVSAGRHLLKSQRMLAIPYWAA